MSQNHATVLQLADEADPGCIEKIARVISIVDTFSPTLALGMAEDVGDILDAQALEVEKTAGFDPGAAAGIAAGTVAAGIGISAATQLYEAAKRGFTRAGNMKRMLQVHPDLAQLGGEERVRRDAVFDMVHRYTPEFTTDPLLAGSIVRSIVDMPRGGEQVPVQNLLAARKNLIEAQTKLIGGGGDAGKALFSRDKEPKVEATGKKK